VALLVGVVFSLALAVTTLRAGAALAFIMVHVADDRAADFRPGVQDACRAGVAASQADRSCAGAGNAQPDAGRIRDHPGDGAASCAAGRDHPGLRQGFRACQAADRGGTLLDGASPLAGGPADHLPLLGPFLLSAAILVFVAGTGNFGIPALLGLPVGYLTLPTLLYQKLASFGPSTINDAAAISVLIALIAGTGRHRCGMVACAVRKPSRDRSPHRAVLEAGPGALPWRLVWGFIALTVLLPLASLLATSLVPAYGVRLSLGSVTLAQYAEVLFRQDLTVRAFRNSMLLAGGAALSLAVIALVSAYVLDRAKPKARVVAFALVELPYAVPGIVLAIACILLFIKPLPVIGVSIYATPWIILFAYHARFFAIALKPVMAAMATLDSDAVQEAAICDGARLGQRLRHIVLPLVLPAVLAGMLMVFLLAFNELTVSALLWSAGTETLGVALLSLEDSGLGAEAAAVAVTATLLVLALMLAMQMLARRLPANALPWQALAGPDRRSERHPAGPRPAIHLGHRNDPRHGF
jgi:iron(III) transport system permease protein